MKMNATPMSPSSAKVIGFSSLYHLKLDDQLNANFASGKRLWISELNFSTGPRSEVGNSHHSRSGMPVSRYRSPRSAVVRIPNLGPRAGGRSEEHTSELQSHSDLVCRLLLEK